MKALILVGGYGTRLRPLTLTTPKPLIDFCNKPILFYQIEALINVGVEVIVLAVSYLSEQLEKEINKFIEGKDVKVIFSQEKEPLGTAGPLALAKPYLDYDDSPIFVMNSDIICEFPLEEMYVFYKEKNKKAVIAVTKVSEPSKYGVLVFNEDDYLVTNFIEKPTNFVSNMINAGIYIIDVGMLSMIEVKSTSIERDVFPRISEERELCAFNMKGIWMDIGQPKDYLIGVKLYLDSLKNRAKTSIEEQNSLNRDNNVLISKTAIVGKGCKIGPNVVLGDKVVVNDGVMLSNCVIMKNSVINPYSYIKDSIIGMFCKIGSWVRIESYAVLGEDVNIMDEVYVNGCKILPHKAVNETPIAGQIIM